MKINDWLVQAAAELKKSGIATSRLDCLVLLEDAVGKDRSYILAHSEYNLGDAVIKKLDTQIERRARHEPLAYIRGKSEFYGREFIVSRDTLEPRPETETLVELARQVIGDSLQVTVFDVGTGSGAIAITMKLELPQLEVCATEINPAALKVARKNADKLDANVSFYQGNLLEPVYNLEPITSNLFAILANLPYVPDAHTINEAAMYEPKIAIFGGTDGLDLYRKLFDQIHSNFLRDRGKNWNEMSPSYILTESLPFQHAELTKIAQSSGYKLNKTDDFIQVFAKG